MDERTGKDVLRQVLNLAGAIGQVAIAFTSDVGAVSDGIRNPIVPAGYAFAIWGVIFALLGVYAVVQALPGQSSNYLYRQIGWWTAAAMIGNTLWTVLFTDRSFVLAQLVIFLIALCAILALVTWADVVAVRPANAIACWIVGPALGLLAGWVTAASFVGVATTLVAHGWNGAGIGAALGGSALLLCAGGVAAWTMARSSAGPATGWVACGVAVLWALVAVVVAQADRTVLVVATAVVIALLVVALLALLVWESRRGTPAPGALGA